MTHWRAWFQDTVSSAGDSIAASHYDSQRSFRARQRLVLDWIGDLQGKIVVDIGPGAGHFCAPLALHNRVIGVDFVPQMLQYAANKGLVPVQGDAHSLPVASARADVVICVGVLQHSDQPDELLRELLRICKPGGTIYLVTLNRESLVRYLYYRLTLADEIMHTYRMVDLMERFEIMGPGVQAQAGAIYYPFVGVRRVGRHPGASRWLSTAFALRVTTPQTASTMLK